MAWTSTITNDLDYTTPYAATIRRGQIRRLEQIRSETGRSVSSLIREAIDGYLAQLEGAQHDVDDDHR